MASGPDSEAPTQRLGPVGIFSVLRGLQPDQGMLDTRGGFIECSAGFYIIQMGTSPYLTSTLVSVIL